MEGVGDHGGAAVGDEVGLGDHLDVAAGGEDMVALDAVTEHGALGDGGGEVEVNDVAVAGVVEGEDEGGGAVAEGAGDEVGEARRRREGVDGEGLELGLDEEGGRE